MGCGGGDFFVPVNSAQTRYTSLSRLPMLQVAWCLLGGASRQMTLDDLATKINSEAALDNKKCFSPNAVLIKTNQNDKYILAIVLDKSFSNK